MDYTALIIFFSAGIATFWALSFFHIRKKVLSKSIKAAKIIFFIIFWGACLIELFSIFFPFPRDEELEIQLINDTEKECEIALFEFYSGRYTPVYHYFGSKLTPTLKLSPGEEFLFMPEAPASMMQGGFVGRMQKIEEGNIPGRKFFSAPANSILCSSARGDFIGKGSISLRNEIFHLSFFLLAIIAIWLHVKESRDKNIKFKLTAGAFVLSALSAYIVYYKFSIINAFIL